MAAAMACPAGTGGYSRTMLFLKRLLTAAVFFVILFVVFFLAGAGIMGGIAGAKVAQTSGSTDFQSGYNAGRKAGEEAGRRYGFLIFFGAAGTAGMASLGISFSGLLPWCRRPAGQL